MQDILLQFECLRLQVQYQMTKISTHNYSMQFKHLTSTNQEKTPQSTTRFDREDYLDIVDVVLQIQKKNQIYYDDRDQGSFSFSYFISHPEQPLSYDPPILPTIQTKKTEFESSLEAQTDVKLVPSLKSKKDKNKNSNTIKKYGRLILDHLKEYDLSEGKNLGIENMMRMLNRQTKASRSEVNKRDRFNTYHLKAMLKSDDPTVNAHNLKVTRIILNKYLRKNVLGSRQISQKSKMTYMNTLKCCSLRCQNTDLALRLQVASERRRSMIAQL